MDLKHLELHDCNQNVGTKSFSLPQLMERQFQSLNVVSTCMRWKFPGEKQERLREYTISEFPKTTSIELQLGISQVER